MDRVRAGTNAVVVNSLIRAPAGGGFSALNPIGTRTQRESGVNQSLCRSAFGIGVGRTCRRCDHAVGHDLDVGLCRGRQQHELRRHVERLQLCNAMGSGGRSPCQASARTTRRGGKGARHGARSQVAGPLPARRRVRPFRRCPLSLFRARLRIRRRRGLMAVSAWLRPERARRS